MKIIRENEHVRLLDYPQGDINEFARVGKIYPDGKVWLVNQNMPYVGTINKVVSKKEFERMTNLTV